MRAGPWLCHAVCYSRDHARVSQWAQQRRRNGGAMKSTAGRATQKGTPMTGFNDEPLGPAGALNGAGAMGASAAGGAMGATGFGAPESLGVFGVYRLLRRIG